MDDTTALHCRNAALKAELAILRDQHATSDNAITYLATRLSSQHSADVAKLEGRIRSLETENAHLRARLGLTSRTEEGPIEAAAVNQSTRESKSRSGSAHSSNGLVQPPVEVDLLGLDDEPCSTRTASFDSDAVSPRTRGSSVQSSVASGGAYTPGTEWSEAKAGSLGPHGQVQGRFSDAGGFAIRHADGTSSFVKPAAVASGSGKPPSDRAPARFGQIRYYLPLSDHQRLLNSAVFTEDIPEEELDVFWARYAKSHGRWCKEEWRAYYEEVVRPEYLAKKSKAGVEIEDTVKGRRASEDPFVGCDDQGVAVAEAAKEERNAATTGEVAHLVGALIDVTDVSPDYTPRIYPSLRGTAQQLEVSGARRLASKRGMTDIAPQEAKQFLASAIKCGRRREHVELVQSPADKISIPEKEALAKAHTSGDVAAAEVSVGSFGPGAMRTFEASRNPVAMVPQREPRQSQCPPPKPVSRPALNDSPTEVRQVFYQPDSKVPSLRRTVLVNGVPRTVNLAEVLGKVGGSGEVLSSVYVETAGMRTTPPLTTNTVLLVFVAAECAVALVERCNDRPLTFDDQRIAARISLVVTPSRPIPTRALRHMQAGEVSRVLSVGDRHPQWTPRSLLTELSHRSFDRIVPLQAGCGRDGVLRVEFAGIDDAIGARDVLNRMGCSDVSFSPEPCEKNKEVGEGESAEVDRAVTANVDV